MLRSNRMASAFYQHAHFIPIVVVGERGGADLLVHGDLQNGSTRYWNYLEDYWPYVGGLSAVNAIGTQLRDPILGTDPMSYDGGFNK